MIQAATLRQQPESLRSHISEIPDFPKPGILFRDIAPLLRNRFGDTIASMTALFSAVEWEAVEVIAGIESRGFILAAGMAAVQNKGFVKIRKPGKLPGDVVRQRYALEYGEDALEMQRGNGRILIVDDVLATGGTLAAAANVAAEAGYDVRGFACLVNLAALNRFSWRGLTARSVVDYAD